MRTVTIINQDPRIIGCAGLLGRFNPLHIAPRDTVEVDYDYYRFLSQDSIFKAHIKNRSLRVRISGDAEETAQAKEVQPESATGKVADENYLLTMGVHEAHEVIKAETNPDVLAAWYGNDRRKTIHRYIKTRLEALEPNDELESVSSSKASSGKRDRFEGFEIYDSDDLEDDLE